MMHKQMIAVLPLLLAPTEGAVQNFEPKHEISDLTAAVDAAATIAAAAPYRLPAAADAAAAGPSLSGSPAAASNTSCSLPCVVQEESFTAAANEDRTKSDTLLALSQLHGGAHIPSQACGPSPLSASEVETLVERIATAQGVDPQLATAVAWAESRFDRIRNSPKGARGPMQLMPATALELGVTDPCDPRANIEGGVRHLKRLLIQFGNPLLAVAAYNAGSRAVIDNNGIPPFAETLGFVASVVSRQLAHSPLSRQTALKLATAPILPRVDGQGHRPGAAPQRFINGVMHLPSQGGLQ